jgi:hypothetical protein
MATSGRTHIRGGVRDIPIQALPYPDLVRFRVLGRECQSSGINIMSRMIAPARPRSLLARGPHSPPNWDRPQAVRRRLGRCPGVLERICIPPRPDLARCKGLGRGVVSAALPNPSTAYR